MAILLACALALVGRWAVADAYDPPANYYNGTAGLPGAALKSQLHTIITTGNSPISYDAARSALQVTDAHPTLAGYILTVYDRSSLNVAAIGGSPPGWNPSIWNREHTWPRSRGVDDNGPDDSDLFLLRPSLTSSNGDRGNLNFGGAYGTSVTGMVVTDGGDMWYPGNADAGMIARQQFFLAVRYDGSESNTNNLELGFGNIADVTGTPDDPPPQLGNLTRLIEWHFAAVPDSFERRRNQLIYDNYQHNRNPFTDHPEYVWSVFMPNNNNGQIAIGGMTANADGSSTKNIDLGRVFVGGTVPSAQSVTLNKTGNDGTYYEVTTSGAATSTVTGRLNAFRTGMSSGKSLNVGLNTTTSAAGLKSGTVTIDNLDVTGSNGSGYGAGDANDTLNVNLTVLDHATPSFAGGSTVTSLMHDFGTVTVGRAAPTFSFDLFNRSSTPGFTADLDFDSVLSAGDIGTLSTNLAAAAGNLSIDAGSSQFFAAMLNTSVVGNFAATYTLMLSEENLPGAMNKTLTLSLVGEVIAAAAIAGDYNRDGTVDAADYTEWRNAYGTSVTPFDGADGDGSGTIDDPDYLVWTAHFGETSASAAGSTTYLAAAPEPGSFVLAAIGVLVWGMGRRLPR